MAMYVIKRCPHCGYVYEYGHDRRGIGKPFLNCEGCNGVIIDTDCTEWDLKGPLGKAAYILICGWTSILYGGLIPMVLFVFGAGKYIGLEANEWTTLGSWGLGVAGFLALSVASNRKDINESQERMKDPDYREFLKTIGLLKK